MPEIITKASSKLREILSEDGSPYLSAGRVGMFICLSFSIGLALLGLFYSDNEKILNYLSLIALQFLGTAVLFYGAAKTSETIKINSLVKSPILDKLNPIADKIVGMANQQVQSQQVMATQPEPAREKPEFYEVR